MNTQEFEKQTLNQLLIDLKDIDNYKSFKNGAFVYDLGHYQGQLLLQEINRLNNIIDELEKEIERLNNIINKAIEYIKYWHYRNDFRVNSFTLDVKEELLNILQGSDKK